MSECRVFNPIQEISILKEKIAHLEKQLADLQRNASYSGYNTNKTWAVGGFPIGYDGQPLKYFLETK